MTGEGRGESGRRFPKPGALTPIKLVAAGALPVAALAWLLLLGPAERRAVLDSIPDGVGERVLRAGLAFAALVALAWGALPLSYHTERACRVGRAWLAARDGPARVLLLPLEWGMGLIGLVFGAVFAVNVLLVVVAFLGALLTIVWIAAPGFLGGAEGMGSLLAAARDRLGARLPD